MEKTYLIDLVKKDVSGIFANVTRQGGKYHYDYQDEPMIRALKRVYIKIEKSVKWLMWEWEPEHDRLLVHDCGYSGIADCENHRINEAYIFIDV